MGSWQAECDRGHAILNKLENVCLLERCENGKSVKMHDVIRDMAINITRKDSRFIVKTRRNLEDFPSEIEWSNNVERVSLMGSRLSTLMFVPNYPRLSTLLLVYSKCLHGFRDSFFLHMVSLRVLDLSYTSISFLPNSIYDMVNLRALILCGCKRLKYVDSLEKLKELRELDLNENCMETIPNGIEKLVLLKKFNWSSREHLPNPLSNLLPNFLQLQCLTLGDGRFPDVGMEKLTGLTKLEILSVKFSSLHNFNSYMRTQHYQRLAHYNIQLTESEHPFLPRFIGSLKDLCKEVEVSECKLKEGGKDNDDYQLVLPTNLQFLHIYRSDLPTSLLDVSPSLKIARDLKECSISFCRGIEYLWWVEEFIASLNKLHLKVLESLRVLFKLRPTDIVSCSSLNHLDVSTCDNLKYLFTPKLVKYHLQNLQTINVSGCLELEDIIAEATKVEEDINEMNDLILCFPNLQSLKLVKVFRLKSIWKGTMTCDSPQQLVVRGCFGLKRLPFLVHINDDDREIRTSIPCLKAVIGDNYWFNELEWDTHPHAKSVFQSLFVKQERVPLYLWERA